MDLFDGQGRVIGVNTAIFTQSGTSAGVGFAIPIDAIAKAVPQLIEYGRIIRPTLNLTVSLSPLKPYVKWHLQRHLQRCKIIVFRLKVAEAA